MKTLWLALFMHRLPLEIFTRGMRALQPCVAIDNHRVAQGNDEARHLGITEGMSLATARVLADNLRVVQRDPGREAAALSQLGQWALRFTPDVAIEPPATLLLQVGPVLRLSHGLHALQARIEGDLQTLGFGCRQVVTATAAAAQPMARNDSAQHPDYFDYTSNTLDHSAWRKALAAVPLDCLDIDDKLIERLHKPGFAVLGDLFALPLHALGRRFGKDFLHYLVKLQGLGPDPRRFIAPAPHYRRDLDFMDPIDHRPALLFPMHRLLDELTGYLQLHDLNCSRLEWCFTDDAAEQHPLVVHFCRPLHDGTAMLELSRARLEALQIARPLVRVALHCRRFTARTDAGADLFGEPFAQNQAACDRLIDKLRTRLDSECIYRLATRDSHVPEQASRAIDATTDALPRDRMQTTAAQLRPAWLYRRPLPVRRTFEGFFCHGGRLTLLQGPERIEAYWGRRPVQRDYFVARHENGGIHWIFHDLQRDRWYAHGLFA